MKANRSSRGRRTQAQPKDVSATSARPKPKPRQVYPLTGAKKPVELEPTDGQALGLNAAPASLWSGRRRLSLEQGAVRLPDRATFEKLARRDDVPGALGVREVKFLLTDVDGPNPKLYFINTNNLPYHYYFASRALGLRLSNAEFNAQTYFRDDRKFLAGTLVAHDQFEGQGAEKGLYTMEFWPTDPVKADHVAQAFKAISQAMPFAAEKLRYHPAGDTQEELFRAEAPKLEQLGVSSIDTASLFENIPYSPLNPGEGFGVLRVMDAASPSSRPPSVRDVVIFKTLPNDLTHVGGVISEMPQTVLSHVNLKAKQNDTPNAYIKDASTDPRVAPFIGKLVHYRVGPDGFELREASSAEADAWLEQVRPKRVQKPPRDLSVTRIESLDDLGHRDVKAFGAKAANVAELAKLLDPGMVPGGYAIPFSFYDEFMKANGLYEAASRMMEDPSFKEDPAVRERMLTDFRRRLRRARIPEPLAEQIREVQARFPPDAAIRARSSTNNEDLVGFNGAGLYDSYTHRPNEGDLGETVKQVWASLWNYRAFEEREFNRIDHLTAAMGVLLHQNFDDEVANGVAVTKNIYDPNWPGFYVNAQVGESLVTNPDPKATSDELLISAIGPNREYETQYIRRSSLAQGERVLTPEQTSELVRAMEKIQEHFKRVYRAGSNPDFAMDLEFKIDRAGKLVVKQARPWVD